MSVWAPFALVKAEVLWALRSHVVVDDLVAFGLVVLPMVGMVVMMLLLGSAEPTTAMSDSTMLILPP
jgi:hypothetical protein